MGSPDFVPVPPNTETLRLRCIQSLLRFYIAVCAATGVTWPA